MRQDVGERHFLGDAHRLATVGNRISEDEEPRCLGHPRQRGKQERAGRIDTGRRLMMLVEHDLQAALFRDLPLLDETIEQLGSLFRIVVPIGQIDAHRLVFARGRQIVIRGFAEMPNLHDCALGLNVLRTVERFRQIAPAARDAANARPQRRSRAARPE